MKKRKYIAVSEPATLSIGGVQRGKKILSGAVETECSAGNTTGEYTEDVVSQGRE
jgi:hypothetical protein